MEVVSAMMVLIQYGVSVFVPAPGFAASGDEPSLADLKECRAALESFADEPHTFGAAEDAEAVDPAFVAILFQFALQIITALINRKKPA
jgi:hypothetical protein